MAKNIRRAAKKVIKSRGSHRLLGLVIFDEKIVCESLNKTVGARANASLSVLKWAREEDNLALRDVFSKVFEVSSIWTSVWKDFSDEYLHYRGAFKEVLHQERALDEVRKKEMTCTAKLNKLQKQLDHSKRKSGIAGLKSDNLVEEIGQVQAEAEQANAELAVKLTKHEIFKAFRLRGALKQFSESLEKLAEKTVSICGAYRKLAEEIPDTPTQLSESKVFPGAGKTRSVVSDLATELGFDPDVHKKLAEDGSSLQTYLYSVSPPVRICQDVPAIEGENGKPQNENGAGSPSPLDQRKTHQHNPEQKFGRPLSLLDLRTNIAPSTAPKPVFQKESPPTKGGLYQGLKVTKSVPVLTDSKISNPSASNNQDNLWYARSGRLDVDSDDDSDGYTEPLENYLAVRPRISGGRLFSDGALNEVQKRGMSAFVDPCSERTCAILSRDLSNDDSGTIRDESDYLEVINS